MKLKTAGYFREMFEKPTDFPSIHLSISSQPQEHEREIVEYLQAGVMLAGCLGLEIDVLNPRAGDFLECHILTDGVWKWRADLAHYVERYHFIVPVEFVEHMQTNGWKVPAEQDMDPSIFE